MWCAFAAAAAASGHNLTPPPGAGGAGACCALLSSSAPFACPSWRVPGLEKNHYSAPPAVAVIKSQLRQDAAALSWA